MVSGRLGAAGVAGLLRVGCSVIPAGLARVPGRRPSGLPVPCEASPAGGAAAAGPAVDGPRSAGSLPPPRPAGGPVSLAPRLADPRPCCRAPPHGGGSRACTGPGAVAGCLGEGAARRAGGSCGLKGVPAAAAAAARLAWSLGGVCGGKVAPRGVEERGLVAVAHAGPWGLLAEGASAGGPSGPAVLWEGVRRGKAAGVPRLGAWALSRTRVRVPV